MSLIHTEFYSVSFNINNRKKLNEDIDSELEEKSICEPFSIKYFMLLTETLYLRINEVHES